MPEDSCVVCVLKSVSAERAVCIMLVLSKAIAARAWLTKLCVDHAAMVAGEQAVAARAALRLPL